MKTLRILLFSVIIIFLSTVPAFAADYPAPVNSFFVNDFSGVIDDSIENGMLNAAVELQEKTGAQVVAVTVDSIGDNTIEQYAYGLFKEWGIGQKDKNNGVLILVAVKDRISRIEVGVGLEGALPDAKTGRIQDTYMLPNFKQNDYTAGISGGYAAIIKEVYKEYGIDVDINDIIRGETYYPVEDEDDNGFPFGGIIFIILFLLFDWIFLKGSITRALLFFGLFGGRRGGGGFGGGRGGFGGGGFSGGGGRSGGGGSSRRW